MSYDTIVIGAGVMGSAVALALARAGQRVLVLEKAVPGAEASSAAAGILAPQVEAEQDGPLVRLGLASRAAYPAFVDEIRELTGEDLGYRRCGAIHAAATSPELEALVARARWQQGSGLAVEVLRGDALPEREHALAAGLAGGLLFPDEAQIDAQALARALPLAARRAGAEIRTAAGVRVRTSRDRSEGVESDAGAISSGAVVVAAGAWTAQVAGTGLPADAVAPVRGQMVLARMEREETMPERVVFGPSGYAVPRSGRRVLLGSTMERVGFDKRVTLAGVASILAQALALLPGLATATLESSWAGFRPAPRDGLPLIGATATAGLFVASGHHRNGILLTPATAELIRDAVLGRTARSDAWAFRPDRFVR